MSTFFAQYPISPGAGGGGGVTSLNSLTGDINLLAGPGVLLTPSGQDLTISSALTPGDITTSTPGAVIVNGLLATAGPNVTIDFTTALFPVISPITAQGDIIYGNPSGVPVALAVDGAPDGAVLTLSSGQPSWAVPAVVPALITARAFGSTTTTISSTPAAITWANVGWDDAGGFDSASTPENYTVPQFSGRYQINVAVLVSATLIAANNVILEARVNGTAVTTSKVTAGGAEGTIKAQISDIITLLSSDVLEIFISSTGTTPAIVSSTTENTWSLAKVSPTGSP